jgi:SAM-dependent methyltransferase
MRDFVHAKETRQMSNTIIAPAPLYTFLSYCSESPLEKEVLDCGAGGECPPLALFAEHGYRVHGVDISDKQLALARQFCKEHAIDLDLILADVRDLPFDDESMSFVYSHDSICHMTKQEVAIAMREINRVLKAGGLCYVNFLSVEDGRFGEGQQLGPGEFTCQEHDETYLHCFFEDNEPDQYFGGFALLRREKHRTERFTDQGSHVCADIGYIARKL